MTHQVFALGGPIGAGPPKEPRRLHDAGRYLLATITLRDGAELPVHVAQEALILTGLEGTGELTLDDGESPIPLEPGTVVTLEAGQRHGLRTATGLRVLLVRVRA